MLEAIEKLLILQDRDRKISRLKRELANIGPERDSLKSRTSASAAALDAARLKAKQIESDRKRLELDVEAKKQQIEKYSLQQFQTKKNEEYRALAHEIELARKAIVTLEDQQLDLMEDAERVQKQVSAASASASEAKALSERLLADLTQREESLVRDLADLESNREGLLAGVDEEVLRRYERIRKSKGETVVVGVAHGVCGGCHMKLPTQVIVSCQGEQEIVNCPNCGRILYYTRDMSLVVAD